MNSFEYLLMIWRRARRMFAVVTRVMLPVMVLVYVAERFGLTPLAGRALAPAMAWLGLPPQAGLIWATTILTNIYGGIATLAGLAGGLEMNGAQISALGAMMLYAHNVPTEQSVAHRAGASALFTGALRLSVAAFYGAAVSWGCRLFGWLQEPVSFAWLQAHSTPAAGPPGVLAWALATAQSLALILVIIVALVVLLDVLERLRVTRLVTRALTPVLRISGLDARAAPITTLGVLLGLTYGGALIIDATEREHYDRRTRLLALSWLSLFHGIIEDTLLIAALGANLWLILVLRGLVTLGVMSALAALTHPRTRWGRRLADPP